MLAMILTFAGGSWLCFLSRPSALCFVPYWTNTRLYRIVLSC